MVSWLLYNLNALPTNTFGGVVGEKIPLPSERRIRTCQEIFTLTREQPQHQM